MSIELSEEIQTEFEHGFSFDKDEQLDSLFSQINCALNNYGTWYDWLLKHQKWTYAEICQMTHIPRKDINRAIKRMP